MRRRGRAGRALTRACRALVLSALLADELLRSEARPAVPHAQGESWEGDEQGLALGDAAAFTDGDLTTTDEGPRFRVVVEEDVVGVLHYAVHSSAETMSAEAVLAMSTSGESGSGAILAFPGGLSRLVLDRWSLTDGNKTEIDNSALGIHVMLETSATRERIFGPVLSLRLTSANISKITLQQLQAGNQKRRSLMAFDDELIEGLDIPAAVSPWTQQQSYNNDFYGLYGLFYPS